MKEYKLQESQFTLQMSLREVEQSVSLKDRYTTYAISGLTNLATVTATNRIYRAKPINNTGGTLIPPLDGVGINLEWGAGSEVQLLQL
jgi:hypothetical protein